MTSERASHLHDIRTNSSIQLHPEDDKFCAFLELVLIGYQANYVIDSDDNNVSGKTRKVITTTAARILLDSRRAKDLQAVLDKVVSHLASLDTIAEANTKLITQGPDQP